MLEQLLFQLIAGYSADSSAKILREDTIFRLMLNKESLASQSSLSRFWVRVKEEIIVQFPILNQALIDKVQLERNATELIIVLNSTHSDTFGNQEDANFNSHYGTNDYQLSMA